MSGGTFALYALLTRAFNVSSRRPTDVSDLEISGYEPSFVNGQAPNLAGKEPAPRKDSRLAAKLKGDWQGWALVGR